MSKSALGEVRISLNVPWMRTPRIAAPIKNEIRPMPDLTECAGGKAHIVNAQGRRTVTHSRGVVNYAAYFLSQFHADA
jgi:hypothetical protein